VDLVDGAAVGHRVVDHRAQNALGVDHEGRADGLRVGRARLDHAVGTRHGHVEIGDDREGDVDAEAFLDERTQAMWA
jgi:hypothetical protein